MTSGPSDGDPPEQPPAAGGWGQPPPPEQPPDQSHGGAAHEPARARRNPLAVTGGVILGLFFGFSGLPLLSGALTELAGAWALVLSFGVPIVLGLVLLAVPKLRRTGAGLILGLSIGLIVGSASCLGLIGLFVASYSA